MGATSSHQRAWPGPHSRLNGAPLTWACGPRWSPGQRDTVGPGGAVGEGAGGAGGCAEGFSPQSLTLLPQSGAPGAPPDCSVSPWARCMVEGGHHLSASRWPLPLAPVGHPDFLHSRLHPSPRPGCQAASPRPPGTRAPTLPIPASPGPPPGSPSGPMGCQPSCGTLTLLV